MNIGVLTSSRADFGIYLPLLKAMEMDSFFHCEIIAFGTHLSKFHGYTLNEIFSNGFKVKYLVPSLLVSDDPESISTSFALTALKFATFWKENQFAFDLVLCLGDRFEMAAAVMAGIPFNIRFAHLYGGETTLGAIDNLYRDCITLGSKVCFTSTAAYANKVDLLTESQTKAVVIGSLSLDNMLNIKLLSLSDFLIQWGIDLGKPSILVTLHPETIAFGDNEKYVKECINALLKFVETHQIIITMPNADTNGSIFREAFEVFKNAFSSRVFLIENFGTQAYFSCMKYVQLIIGNSSSGIIEAASFEKFVINLGDRQKGRLTSNNVIHIPFDSNKIISAIQMYLDKRFTGKNIYYKENPTGKVIETLKSIDFE